MPSSSAIAMATGERCGRKSRVAKAAMRALRGARDLYVRGVKGLDGFVAAANPRAGVGRPTSRVFGVRDLNSEQELLELVRAMQARHSAGTGGVGDKKAEADVPAVRRGAVPLEKIDEDAAVVHPIK